MRSSLWGECAGCSVYQAGNPGKLSKGGGGLGKIRTRGDWQRSRWAARKGEGIDIVMLRESTSAMMIGKSCSMGPPDTYDLAL